MSPEETTTTAPELLVVVGPTASGKTELAIRLARALDGEVINADSVQVYRYFDIGSGKPTPEELASVPHHLVSELDPMDELDAARWAALAESAVVDVVSRGKRPVVCGGSFLWVRALLFGLAKAPKADAELRAAHKAFVEAEGRAALHARLMRVDPVCATKLSPNDFVRVSRALEVFELTGTPMSQWQAEHGFREPKRPYRLLGVARERAEMDERIHTRAKAMLAAGFIEEVLGLCKRGYGDARAMGSVGYREVKTAVDAHLESGQPIDRDALLEAIAQKTRVFARRQRTWLRDEPVTWVKAEDAQEPALRELIRPGA
ncbi:MAG: tRNA (adenosine(37)-N6)-dimethylallyltransferase MiaA [Polyangiaceae bacterium]